MNQIPKKVLIVDDQINWRKMLQTVLQKEGYGVQTVDNFESARKKILSIEIDLLILDVRLVDEDVFNVQGLELLKLANEKQKKAKTIILTGYPESIREGVWDTLNVSIEMHKVPDGGRFSMQEFVGIPDILKYGKIQCQISRFRESPVDINPMDTGT